MTRPTMTRRLPVAAALIAAAAAVPMMLRAAPPAALPGGTSGGSPGAVEPAYTRPSLELKLAFAGPGLVSDAMVKEGDPVKADQLLAKQDDRGAQVTLRELEGDADSMAEIEYEKADQADKQVIYDRKMMLHNQDGVNASQSEVDEAKLAVALAHAQIQVAEQKHDKAVLQAQEQKIKVEQMQMRSPIDGTVAAINTHAGEMADPANKDGSITVVKNDPLWVVIHPSTDRALKLSVGQELQVRYAAPFGVEPMPWQPARVIYFAPKADAASKTEEVRLELANPGAGSPAWRWR